MDVELTQSVEVGSGGKIELVFPELAPGQTVKVHVVAPDSAHRKRAVFGRLKGLVTILDEFDDPLPDLDDYQ